MPIGWRSNTPVSYTHLGNHLHAAIQLRFGDLMPAFDKMGLYAMRPKMQAAGFSPRPVSYTHLDVYKRQEKHWFAVHSSSFRYKEYYEHLMALRGCLARTRYAEAFAVDEYTKKQVLEGF